MTRRILIPILCALGLAAGVSSADAATLRGTLSYTDGDGSPTPIRRARVEVRIFRARPVIWWWETEVSTTTDNNGFYNVEVPWYASDVRYSLHVYATNPAAQVFTPDLYTVPFYREPGLPNAQLETTAATSTSIMTLGYNFPDLWATRPFNIADAILRGFDYANARRDPRQTDVNTRVDVLLNTVGSTYYDPVSHAVRMDAGVFGMDDFTVLHEYGHRLEEQLSSFLGLAASHNGCTGFVEPGYAWMEGFASYFAEAVARAAGNDAFGPLVDGGRLGTLSPGFMENPSCPGSTAPRMNLEVFVAGALFDLIDGFNGFEPADGMCTLRTGAATDTLIFQIFDHELDIGWTNPTLQLFIDAWINRGLDVPPLLGSLSASSIFPVAPGSVVRYDNLAAYNLAVWRPGISSVWYILGSLTSGVEVWGITGDKPVPADYDGDGFTDVAIWRPLTGEWWIKLSAGGRNQTVQWGANGDIPLPGDYDGDAETDLAVYRPSTGQVFIHGDECGGERVVWVGSGTPVVGYFDGDSVDEPGIYVAATSTFTIRRANGTVLTQTVGAAGSQPVVADYDGDGRSDYAVFRASTGIWTIRASLTGAVTSTWWGAPGEIPVPGDYDGDGRADIVTWQTIDGTWWILEADGNSWSYQWGTPGDVPVSAP